MAGFFWNIRGFNKYTKQLVVRDWLNYGKLSFGCIVETRVKEENAASIARRVFQDWSFVTNYEFSRLGRIWVVWNKSVKLVVLSKTSQVITCMIEAEGIDGVFCCSFVYASNFLEERKLLWSELLRHKEDMTFSHTPWICCGDFNEVLSIDEHVWSLGSPMVSPGMSHFQDLVRKCAMMDMSSQGPLFTWNNRQGSNLVSKKLDRCLMKNVGFAQFQQAYCVFDSGGCSDHLRGRFSLKNETRKPHGPFKFSNVITTLPEFLPIMKSSWEDAGDLFHSTSALFRFGKRLKSLKPALRDLSKNNLANISVRAKDALDELKKAQEATLINPSLVNASAESLAMSRWEKVSFLEEKFMKQKSKLHWLRFGDSNSRVFYNAITVRRARNAIREIQTSEGFSLTDMDEIKTEAGRFFQEFLQHVPPDFAGLAVESLRPLLNFECSQSAQDLMVKDVSEVEIKKTLFAMPKNKSPGPDGFTVEFFKEAWSIIGKDCTVAIQSFFRFGFLPKGLNATILALIPKKDEAKFMKDYRPISCCNVIYKVISKIIANRLKCFLPDFIAPNQSAFVRDRLLMENLLLATELVKNYHKEGISPRCTMKIDISKAFDSIQWSFLLNVLKAINVPLQFIRWIELCISTASFSVQVNGELAGFFHSSRGLRQGCSLSPYLFVICMNVLSKLLDKAAQERNFGFHPGCKNLKVTHLCFADDLLVFTDGSTRSMEGILNVFKVFAEVSGLKISLEKSTLFLAGVSNDQRISILERFPFESGSLPVRYLGLPLLTKRMTVADYTPLLEKIKSRICSWTSRFLSFAGRLQLLKSVISSLTNFWIMAFRLPKGCIREIEKICAAFLWSGPDLNPRKTKVCWEDVCLPKEEGGLGLKRLCDANKVSMLKLIWRLLTATNSLWVDWVRRELIRRGSLWSANEMTHSGSWIWRKIIKYRGLARDFYRVDVGDGRTSSFWFDPWCNIGCLYDRLGSRGFIDLGLGRDATLADALERPRVRRFRFKIHQQIANELLLIRSRSSSPARDEGMWKDCIGSYKKKFSSFDTWDGIRRKQQHKVWCTSVWFARSTPKYSFITWLAVLRRLATGDRMMCWGPNVNPNCVFCNTTIETREHLFFDCGYSKWIWRQLMARVLGAGFTHKWDEILELMRDNQISGSRKFILRYGFQCTIHSLWTERNKRRNGDKKVTGRHMVTCIDRIIRNKLSTLAHPGSKLEDGLRVWFDTR